MPASLSITLHNAMMGAQHFTVVDDITSQQVFDGDLDEDATKDVKIAPGIGGQGQISYTPRNGQTMLKIGLDDGDTVDMD